MLTNLKQKMPIVIIVALFLHLTANLSFAAEQTKFTTKGNLELGGNFAYLNSTDVSNGQVSSSSTSYFSFAPNIGYFITNNFEIALDPFSYSSTSTSDSKLSTILFFVAPTFNFDVSSNIYPYTKLLLGYNLTTYEYKGTTTDQGGFCWGLNGGVKVELAKHALLNLGVQYLQITSNPKNADNRYGANYVQILAGFSIWL